MDGSSAKRKVPETVLQQSWGVLPSGSRFRLSDGHLLTIVSPGILNKHAGPDYLDACLEFNGVLRRGNVEMHCRTSDWIAHGHAENAEYDNVILHVVMEDDTTPENVAFLPNIPVLCLHVDSKTTASPSHEILPQALCSSFFSAMEQGSLREFLESAGIDRLREKSSKYLSLIIAHGDRKAFLAGLADQYGVPDNRDAFHMLGERLLAYPDDLLDSVCSAILWGESGLLPDPGADRRLTSSGRAVAKTLWDAWWPIRPDAGENLRYRRRCRPMNSPERRLAALAAWGNAFTAHVCGELEELFSGGSLSDLFKSFADRLKYDPFWMNHTSFRSKELANGAELFPVSRIAELITDVVLPFLLASSILRKDESLEKKVLAIYLQLPALQSNRTVRIMHASCFAGRKDILKSAAAQQGMLHIYQKHCKPGGFYCRTCTVYRSFNTQD